MRTESGGTSARLPWQAAVAAGVACLLAGGALLNARHHIWYLLAAITPAMAAVGILRKRAWGAYGFALFQTVQLIVSPALLLADGRMNGRQVAGLVISGFLLAALFLWAYRAMRAAGTRAGSAVPWVVLIVVFTLPLLFVRAFAVPTGGMENTLLPGDRLLVRVLPRLALQRGNVVVFRYPLDRRQIYIKRVIGVGGDRIRIVSRVVYRNGQQLVEPYVIERYPPDVLRDNLTADSRADAFAGVLGVTEARAEMLRHRVAGGEIQVPPSRYFVLGDNRDTSLDSRYWGFLDGPDVVGVPFMIYDSEEPTVPGPAGREGTKTRWERVFKVL